MKVFALRTAPWLAGFWLLTVVFLACVWAVSTRVDLSPQVESDFFFSSDDPAYQASRRVGELFPSNPQILVVATSENPLGPEGVDRVRILTGELASLEGVNSVQSLTSGPSSPMVVPGSPVWSRLLLSEDPRVTNIVLSLHEPVEHETVSQIEEVVRSHDSGDFALRMSGVPYVVELIRRHLLRDLRVFTASALLVFGLVILLVYRSAPLVVGTLLTCVGACLLSLTVLHLLHVPIGMLTANLATIVFVLTLSHTVFLSANWRRVRPGLEPRKAVYEAVRITLPASFWCMVAALLGFGSLLLATAKPLRELGTSGTAGTVVAFLVAYGYYPTFLGMATARPPKSSQSRASGRISAAVWPALLGLLALVAGLGLPRLDTDPSLFSYFAADSAIRKGLEKIDESGGSSPLSLVVENTDGGRLDDRDSAQRMGRLQTELESDPAVGVVLSADVLIQEARLFPLAALFTPAQILDILASDQYDQIARSFITANRTQSLFLLRMRETGREEPRQAVVERLALKVRDCGLALRIVGGLYDLQGKLGKLVARSLGREIGGLLFFFLFVAVLVARSLRTGVAMVFSLAAVPVIILGAVGFLGQPMDVIAAPGANVAISLGIDAMIHLVMAVRRRLSAGVMERVAWGEAIGEMRPAIVGAMSILAAGFGIFVLSSFPPTRRFGVLVAVGSLVSAAMALVVLPYLANLPIMGRRTSRAK